MNKNLVKIGKVYRYNFSDNDILTGKLRMKLSGNTEFLADYVTFVVDKGMVKEIEVRGCVIYPENRGKKRKQNYRLDFWKRCRLTRLRNAKLPLASCYIVLVNGWWYEQKSCKNRQNLPV